MVRGTRIALNKPARRDVLTSIERSEPVALATVISGSGRVGAKLAVWPERTAGGLASDGLDAAVSADAGRGVAGRASCRGGERVTVLDTRHPRPRASPLRRGRRTLSGELHWSVATGQLISGCSR